jgi:uncharacterized protein (DUF1697 family)
MGKGPTALFLRGINVGGRHKVPMDDLRSVLDDLGLGPTTTHLQSGNAIITATPGVRVEKRVAEALQDEFEFAVPVATRSAADMASVIERNPFVKAARKDAKTVHVHFLAAEPEPKRVADLDPDRWTADEWVLDGRELYVHYKKGSAESKLNAGDIERQLGVVSTARNWRTVEAMAEMAAARP